MPIISTGELLRLFVGAILLGIGCGIVYDLFRITRVFFDGPIRLEKQPAFIRKLPPFADFRCKNTRRFSELIINLEDIIFFLVVGCAISVYLSVAANGMLRWLTVFGIVFGFLSYYFTVGRLIMLCSKTIAALTWFVFLWIVWCFWIPLAYLGRKIKKLFLAVRDIADLLWSPLRIRLVFQQERNTIRRRYSKIIRRKYI